MLESGKELCKSAENLRGSRGQANRFSPSVFLIVWLYLASYNTIPQSGVLGYCGIRQAQVRAGEHSTASDPGEGGGISILPHDQLHISTNLKRARIVSFVLHHMHPGILPFWLKRARNVSEQRGLLRLRGGEKSSKSVGGSKGKTKFSDNPSTKEKHSASDRKKRRKDTDQNRQGSDEHVSPETGSRQKKQHKTWEKHTEASEEERHSAAQGMESEEQDEDSQDSHVGKSTEAIKKVKGKVSRKRIPSREKAATMLTSSNDDSLKESEESKEDAMAQGTEGVGTGAPPPLQGAELLTVYVGK
jgi:hypothetical protein